MRLFEFEGENEDLKSLIPSIKAQCSEFISQAAPTGKYLYRGCKTYPDKVFQSATMDGRKPVDTSLEDFEMINDWLEERGFEAKRDNSLFVSSVVGIAKRYGPLYVIFPKNGFKFTWFENCHDLWMCSRDFKPERLNLYKSEPFANSKQVDMFMKWAKPQNTNIAKAIEARNEVMIKGEFWAVPFDPYDDNLEVLLQEIYK